MTREEAINTIRYKECTDCIGNEIGCGDCAYLTAIDAIEFKSKTMCGYDLESLYKIAVLLQNNEITVSDIKDCATNLESAYTIVKNTMDKFISETITNFGK